MPNRSPIAYVTVAYDVIEDTIARTGPDSRAPCAGATIAAPLIAARTLRRATAPRLANPFFIDITPERLAP
jgi:hypothetical protein